MELTRVIKIVNFMSANFTLIFEKMLKTSINYPTRYGSESRSKLKKVCPV